MEANELLEKLPREVFSFMRKANAGILCAVMDDKDGNPLGAVIYVHGPEETAEIMEAVNAIIDSWQLPPDTVIT